MLWSLCVALTGQRLVNTDSAFVNVLTRGDLSSLRWFESPLKFFSPAEHPDRKLCHVHYAALNFRDVVIATGKLPPDAIPGTSTSYSAMMFINLSVTEICSTGI